VRPSEETKAGFFIEKNLLADRAEEVRGVVLEVGGNNVQGGVGWGGKEGPRALEAEGAATGVSSRVVGDEVGDALIHFVLELFKLQREEKREQ